MFRSLVHGELHTLTLTYTLTLNQNRTHTHFGCVLSSAMSTSKGNWVLQSGSYGLAHNTSKHKVLCSVPGNFGNTGSTKQKHFIYYKWWQKRSLKCFHLWIFCAGLARSVLCSSTAAAATTSTISLLIIFALLPFYLSFCILFLLCHFLALLIAVAAAAAAATIFRHIAKVATLKSPTLYLSFANSL